MGSLKFPHASGNSMSIAAPATNPASDLELKLPATIGTANQYLKNSSTPGTLEFGTVTVPTKSITHINQWHIPSNTSGSGSNDLTAWNKSADSLGDYALLGSEMSHSSGVFTFPAEGMWLIFFSAWYYADARSSRWFQCRIMTTTNNSSYNQIADCSNAIYDTGSNGYNSCAAMVVFDVTDTSNCKVKFQYDSQNTLEVMGGKNFTSTRFIKIAET